MADFVAYRIIILYFGDSHFVNIIWTKIDRKYDQRFLQLR